MDYFFGSFFFIFSGPFFGLIIGQSFGPFTGGGKPLVLRKGWDAVYQYSRRGGRQTVVTEGGVQDELLERRDEWEVVLLVNATD